MSAVTYGIFLAATLLGAFAVVRYFSPILATFYYWMCVQRDVWDSRHRESAYDLRKFRRDRGL